LPIWRVHVAGRTSWPLAHLPWRRNVATIPDARCAPVRRRAGGDCRQGGCLSDRKPSSRKERNTRLSPQAEPEVHVLHRTASLRDYHLLPARLRVRGIDRLGFR
jgi:hypothetical protein